MNEFRKTFDDNSGYIIVSAFIMACLLFRALGC